MKQKQKVVIKSSHADSFSYNINTELNNFNKRVNINIVIVAAITSKIKRRLWRYNSFYRKLIKQE